MCIIVQTYLFKVFCTDLVFFIHSVCYISNVFLMNIVDILFFVQFAKYCLCDNINLFVLCVFV